MKTAFNPKKAKPTSWLSTFASEHHLRISWLGLLGFGLLWLLAFFYAIGYYPNFDLQAGANVLLSLTFVGVIFSILFSLVCLGPSFWIGYAMRGKAPPAATTRFKNELIGWSLYQFLSLALLNVVLMAYVSRDWEIGFGLVLYMSILVGLIALHARSSLKKVRQFRPLNTRTLRLKRKAKRAVLVRKFMHGRILSGLILGFFQFFPWYYFLMVLAKASDFKHDDFLSFMSTGVYWAGVIAAAGYAVLYITMPRENRRWYAALIPIFFALPLLLTMFANAGGMFPMLVANYTKIGNFRAERIVVSPKSCPALAQILAIDCAQDKESIQLCNVHVISRIGTETYLRLTSRNSKNGNFDVKNVLLPSADIEAVQLDVMNKNLRLTEVDQQLRKSNSLCSPDINDLTLFSDNAFDFDSSTLTEAGKKELSPLIKTATSNIDSIERISVVGHADRIGDYQYNYQLAQQRAEQIRIIIERALKNVRPKINVLSQSHGSSFPLATECVDGKNRRACEAPNRRVEIAIHFKDKSKH